MGFVSIKDMRGNVWAKLPLNAILYRTKKHSQPNNKDKVRVEFIIPRQISTKAGIDHGTMVDVLYDPDLKKCKIQTLKSVGGFCVRSIKRQTGPPYRVKIEFTGPDHSPLPTTDGEKKNNH